MNLRNITILLVVIFVGLSERQVSFFETIKYPYFFNSKSDMSERFSREVRFFLRTKIMSNPVRLRFYLPISRALFWYVMDLRLFGVGLVYSSPFWINLTGELVRLDRCRAPWCCASSQ